MKAFGRYWAHEKQHGNPPEHLGVTLLDGKGSNMEKHMENFVNMKYELCVYKDSDTKDPKISNKAAELNIPVFEYPEGVRTEEAVFRDSPKELQDVLIDHFNNNKIESEAPIEIQPSYDQATIKMIETKLHDVPRNQPGKITEGMYRNIDNAHELGNLILDYWEEFDSKSSGFRKTISNIEEWIYG